MTLATVGLLEFFFYGDRRFHRHFLIKPSDVAAVRMWPMNIGAYDIAFALGISTGLWLMNFSDEAGSGSAIVIFCCASQFLLGIHLWITEKRLLISAM